MDNISHTLIGALVGAYMARTRRESDSVFDENARHALFVPVMAIGSNLPDIDLAYTTILSGKLQYLLHHRGHTHTIVGALLLSLLLWIVCRLWLKRRGLQLQPADRRLLVFICLFGPLLHIVMDATNSYGVHPFWPFDNAWYYFDTIFIVEPLFWAAAAPLFFILRSQTGRGLLALILLAGIGLAWFTNMVPLIFCIGLLVLTAALIWIGRVLEPRLALFVGIVVWLSTTLAFAVANQDAARIVRHIVRTEMPHTTLFDHVLTPMPVNPVCWEVMLVQMQAQQYAVRRAVISVRPQLMSAAECPNRGLNLETTAPLEPVPLANTPQIHWYGEAILSLRDLRQLAHTRCEARALMQFARVPWWAETATAWVIGDLRYDREPMLGFAEIELVPGETQHCPRPLPPWIPPRQDVLDRSSGNLPST